MAAPITYAVNGVQYVAVQVGYGGTNIAGYTVPLGRPVASMMSNP